MKSLIQVLENSVKQWENGKSGSFEFSFYSNWKKDFLCRFIECDETFKIWKIEKVEDRKTQSPTVARGFVAFLLNKLPDSEVKSEVDIYDTYFQHLRNEYKEKEMMLPGSYKRDLDEEFYTIHLDEEQNYIYHSQAILEYLTTKERELVKAYFDNYLEYIGQFSKFTFKKYSSLDEALNDCSIENKILIHTLIKCSNPTGVSHLEMVNDLMMIRATHQKEPSKCASYIIKKYKDQQMWSVAFACVVRSNVNNDSSFALLLTGYSNMDMLKAFNNVKELCRRQLTVHYTLNSSYSIKDDKNPQKTYSNSNLTDEIALYHLVTNPECRQLFSVLPSNVDELIEEFKSKNQNSENTQKVDVLDESLVVELSDLLLIKDQEITNRIIDSIRCDLKISKSPNLSIALFTVALQKKKYLSNSINKTKFHKVLVGMFGGNVGTRSKFNEKFNEINQGEYDNELDEYLKLLP